MKTKLLSLLFIIAFQLINAQNRQLFFQGETIELPINIDSFKAVDAPENTIYDNGFFGWV